jgi:hypothetical protein
MLMLLVVLAHCRHLIAQCRCKLCMLFVGDQFAHRELARLHAVCVGEKRQYVLQMTNWRLTSSSKMLRAARLMVR